MVFPKVISREKKNIKAGRNRLSQTAYEFQVQLKPEDSMGISPLNTFRILSGLST